MNRTEVGTLLNNISMIWPNWEVTALAAEMWWQALAECSKEIANDAFKRWTQESKFPPTISEFRKLALQLAGGKFSQAREGSVGEIPTPQGMVRIGDQPPPWCFYPKEDCVWVDNKWMQKVDFAIEMLGTSKVSEEFYLFADNKYKINKEDFDRVLSQLLITAWAEHERRELDGRKTD